MANYLTTDTDLTSVANAIRAKSGGSGQLAFPAGFVSEIGNIPTGTTYYMSEKTGCYYPKIIDQTLPSIGATDYGGRRWSYCDELEEVTVRGLTGIGTANNYIVRNCQKLKKLILPDVGGNNNSYITTNNPALEEVQLGSVGHYMEKMYGNAFSGCTSAFTLTIYVNAASLANVTTNITSSSPFGATNATIVYRSSTTGEVLT
ncbi:MAG: hypothetical protein J5725_08705 [Bacteroidales bacterium]|nr:hypothetical protein [Bacteroidales bacterium]